MHTSLDIFFKKFPRKKKYLLGNMYCNSNTLNIPYTYIFLNDKLRKQNLKILTRKIFSKLFITCMFIKLDFLNKL